MPRPLQLDGRLHGVIGGVRNAQGRWLLIRRAATVAAPGKICFPGGAIERGEHPEQAIAREFVEEVALPATPIRQVWRYVAPERNLVLHGYLMRMRDGSLPMANPLEVAELLWLTPHEAATHPDALPRTGDFVAALELARLVPDA